MEKPIQIAQNTIFNNPCIQKAITELARTTKIKPWIVTSNGKFYFPRPPFYMTILVNMMFPFPFNRTPYSTKSPSMALLLLESNSAYNSSLSLTTKALQQVLRSLTPTRLVQCQLASYLLLWQSICSCSNSSHNEWSIAYLTLVVSMPLTLII